MASSSDTSSSSSADLPLLLSMLLKVLDKGHTVQVVETHRTWLGPIVEAKHTENGIEIKVKNYDEERGVTANHSFNIRQPERWKLGKHPDGNWCLWPPRAKSRRK